MSSKHISRRVDVQRHGGISSFRWRASLSVNEEVWIKHFASVPQFTELTKGLDKAATKLLSVMNDARKSKSFFVDKSVEGEYTQEYLCPIMGTDFNLAFWIRAEVWTGLDTLTQAQIRQEFEDLQKYLLAEVYGDVQL